MPLVTKRLRDPDTNPCLSESDASTRCMDENNYNRERCSSYFLKYKNCRRFWVSLPRRASCADLALETEA
ncbi:coiled-coil-helix-coiled-coil-helix domain-containing protein 7 [Octodon degus]|uniref:Coiled-coil-helix-coiled-coil-helix domain-containing protein 7 n=1 Tax=Octodon degus TaxID=10160 RepID=A0A6P6EN86_OCTDE|nr:coiled-coil-helix-coiled-coil-helix domain-containing protein 7 [Octodon degus]